jgi:hypothetical protein
MIAFQVAQSLNFDEIQNPQNFLTGVVSYDNDLESIVD